MYQNARTHSIQNTGMVKHATMNDERTVLVAPPCCDTTAQGKSVTSREVMKKSKSFRNLRKSGWVDPDLHIWDCYCVSRGGLTPIYIFGTTKPPSTDTDLFVDKSVSKPTPICDKSVSVTNKSVCVTSAQRGSDENTWLDS